MIDYSVFKEGELEGEEGFSNLDINEQIRLMTEVFTIGSIVNTRYEDDDFVYKIDSDTLDSNYVKTIHPNYLELNKAWLRENKINGLI